MVSQDDPSLYVSSFWHDYQIIPCDYPVLMLLSDEFSPNHVVLPFPEHFHYCQELSVVGVVILFGII